VNVDEKRAAGHDIGPLTSRKTARRPLAPRSGTNGAHRRHSGSTGKDTPGSRYSRRPRLAEHGELTGTLAGNNSNCNRL